MFLKSLLILVLVYLKFFVSERVGKNVVLVRLMWVLVVVRVCLVVVMLGWWVRSLLGKLDGIVGRVEMCVVVLVMVEVVVVNLGVG